MLGAGCGTTGTRPEDSRSASRRAAGIKAAPDTGQVTLAELDALTHGLADRYFMVVGSAVESIKQDNRDPVQRRIAHRIKLNGVLALNDIVSANDPFSQVLDVVVAITLQSMVWIDENRAEEVFGDRAGRLIDALRTMRVEAWNLAARVMTQDQLELLDYLILEWRRAHPEVEQVAFVKFDNFSGARANALANQVRSGSGLFGTIAEAQRELREYRRLAEQAFWYSKRAPSVAGVQAEAAVNEILSAPEINSLVATADRLGGLAENMPKLVADERKAILADLDARHPQLTNALQEVNRIVGEASALARAVSLILSSNTIETLASLEATLKTADAIAIRHFPPPSSTAPPSRPFDITEYAAVVAGVNQIVTNLHQFTLHADSMTRSPGWREALRDLSDAADRRVDRVLRGLYILVGGLFVLALLYRSIVHRLARRSASAPEGATQRAGPTETS